MCITTITIVIIIVIAIVIIICIILTITVIVIAISLLVPMRGDSATNSTGRRRASDPMEEHLATDPLPRNRSQPLGSRALFERIVLERVGHEMC